MSATNSSVLLVAPSAALALWLGACNDNENLFHLEVGEIARLGDCNLVVDFAQAEASKFVGVRYSCGVPVVARDEKNWWGSQVPPLAFTIDLGDCLKLEGTWYCVTEIEGGRGATIMATYRERASGEVAERLTAR
jgi:hypothetical protein